MKKSEVYDIYHGIGKWFMKLIVGLGNPGKEYTKTRHNVGFMCIDEIAKHFNISIDSNKFSGLYGELIYNGEKVLLLKPQKYMNLSGEVIRDFVNYFKIDMNDILIISDDLDTEVGTYRLRYKGSSGGHNGLKNIELLLGTQDYKRIKIGISNNKNMDTKDYVLGKFSKEELDLIDSIVKKTPTIIEDYFKLPFDNVMNKYNQWYEEYHFVVGRRYYEYIW